MKKVIFVGASIPNLYGANKLNQKGFEVVVYERNSNLNNHQRRRLPTRLLHKIGLEADLEKDFNYVILSEIKKRLSNNLNIIYNANLEINFNSLSFKGKDEDLQFDFIIINTGHKEISVDNPKVFTYNYSLNDSNNHFSGNSLMSSIEDIEEITNKIVFEQ